MRLQFEMTAPISKRPTWKALRLSCPSASDWSSWIKKEARYVLFTKPHKIIFGNILETRKAILRSRASVYGISRFHFERYPLSIYAALYWAQHVREGSEAKFCATILSTFDLQGTRDSIIQIYQSSKFGASYFDSKAPNLEMLHLAALYDLPILAQGILRPRGNVQKLYTHHTKTLIIRLFWAKRSKVLEESDNFLGSGPLTLAARAGNNEVARVLLKNGANIEALGRLGTPLFCAVEMENIETVRLLLRQGANVKDYYRNVTALHRAVGWGNVGMAKALIDGGAYVDAGDKLFGLTPLQLATEIGQVEMVNFLLDKGAKIGAVERLLGFTALHYAVRYRRVAVSKNLLEKGADIEAKDNSGQTPFDLTREKALQGDTRYDEIFAVLDNWALEKGYKKPHR
jgi:ankyrin repeat protein